MADDFQSAAIVLETVHLSLRPLRAEDAESIFAFGSDAEVTRFVFWPRHRTVEDSRNFVAWLGNSTFNTWAIRLHGSPEVIGTIFLHSLNLHHRKAELAFNLARTSWNKGFSTEAATAVLKYAFGALKLHRIEGTCMVANMGSARVLAKLGFIQEGLARQSHQRSGEFFDMKLFAILSSDAAKTASP